MTAIKIKNSSVYNKVPVAGDLVTAELALNLGNRVLYSKDGGGTVFKIAGSTQSGTTANRPAIPNLGELFYDTDESDFYYYDGGNWEPLTQEIKGLSVGDTPPTIEDVGEMWYDLKGGGLFIAIKNANNADVWVQSL